MNGSEHRLRAIFSEALALESPSERAAFLAQACEGNPRIREEVEELLAAEQAAGSFLPELPRMARLGAALSEAVERTSKEQKGPLPQEPEGCDEKIDRYKLLQRIGEGGCGVVYMAEQLEPVRRKVALKIIKLGMDTRRVVARFEAERQALALMDHPNIAQVLDAGATATGRPFFVMELVRGCKITQYCDRERFSTRQRLQLFILVCQAVQHAHQKGIIHRDLKPSNILVTERDGVPVPKIIDFGIAKATGDLQLTDKTLFTAFEQFIGTPAYMSPEQSKLGELDVDTRTDIYSLGVLLYELLTNKTPFETRALLATGLEEMRRTIREEPPPRPSTRLTVMAKPELTATASHRGVDGLHLVHLLRGDLDWVIMKCLEKDRSRRYETATGLAKDIARHLNNEPVLARPPDRLYEFQKTVLRHKVGFAATAALIVVLAAGVVISTWEARTATRERDKAVAAEQKAAHLQRQANDEANNARLAEADARQKLRDSYLALSKAGRSGRRTGRRFESLDLLKKAAAIRPGPDLRNEAISCLSLPDLRLLKTFPTGLGPETMFVAFDRSGEHYAATDLKGNVWVYRVVDNAQLVQLADGGGPSKNMRFSPDGRVLAAGYWLSDCNTLKFWDWQNAEVLSQAPTKRFRAIAFSPDSQCAAIGQDGGPILLYDYRRARVIESFPQSSLVNDLAFDPSGRLLAISSESPTVRIVSMETGKDQGSLEQEDPTLSLAWSPGGDVLATGCLDGRIVLWDVASARKRQTLTGHQNGVVEVEFNHMGNLLVSRGWDAHLRLWNLVTGTEVCNRVDFHVRTRITPDDAHLLCQGVNGELGLFEFAGGTECRLLHYEEEGTRGPLDCAFSPEGRILASVHLTGLRIWDLSEGAVTLFESKVQARSSIFHPSGKFLFASGPAGLMRIPLTVAADHRVTQVTLEPFGEMGLQPEVDGCCMDREGKLLLVLRDGQAHLMSAISGKELRAFKGDAPFGFVTLSADGRWCVGGEWRSKSVAVFDVGTGDKLIELPATAMTTAAFSPDDRRLLAGGYEEYLAWDTTSWKRAFGIPREKGSRLEAKLAFSPDSRSVALLPSVDSIHLIDSGSGTELATLDTDDSRNISALVFNGDGTKLAVCRWDHIIQLWDLAAIRRQLAELNLDWEPALQATAPTTHSEK